MPNHNYYAFVAGVLAAGGGLFGKLSGPAYESFGLIGGGSCILMMILLNGAMWANFSKSLKLSSTSVGPTVVSSAANFILSGLLGIVIFEERTSLLWWAGIGCVLIGLVLITKGQKQHAS